MKTVPYKNPVQKENGPDADKNFRTVVFLIALLTLLVYLPSTHSGFVNWDDGLYVYDDPVIRLIDLKFLETIFTQVLVYNWHPLTMFSYALDYYIWGLNPAGYHLINMVFHAVNASLVFFLSLRLIAIKSKRTSSAFIASFVTAVLFAVHPLHVESVSWVSERKDVLCGFFYLLGLITYLKYINSEHSKSRLYVTTIIYFILAILSKPMAVSFPLILLIIDFYPLERLSAKAAIEKMPFFILSVISSFITFLAQKHEKALLSLEIAPFSTRVLTALRSYVFYLYKTILPLNLAPYYPYTYKINFFTFEYLGSLITLILITLFCIVTFRRYKIFSAAWLYFLIVLFPVIGIVQVGAQAAADRYMYLPSLSVFLLAGLLAGQLYERSRGIKRVLLISFNVLLAGMLILMTAKQQAIWKDSISLWNHEIELYPNGSAISYFNRGNIYYYTKNYESAIRDYSRAIALDPEKVDARFNRAQSYVFTGDCLHAVEDYDIIIRLDPAFEYPYVNRGHCFAELGEYSAAIEDFTAALRINKQDALTYYYMGLAYLKLNKINEAAVNLRKAEQLGLKDAQTALAASGLK